ncbi:MAG: signal peptidase II [Oscillospiraceae bacterium]|nr:signal peptidase II [Oscillospiraceae bacterium]
MASVLVFLAIVLLDQVVKYWAVEVLQPIHSIPVIDGVLHWTYAENTGAAFSMLSGQRFFLILIPLLVCAVLLCLLLSKRVSHPLGHWALVFLLGGAVGNLIDRVFHGFVVDFVDVRLINFAIFNVADIFVTVGAGMLILYLLCFSEKAEKKHDD